MPVETITNPSASMSLGFLWAIGEGLIILLASLYFVFSLVVVRQINLMTDTLITEVSPALRAFSILHAGLSLGIVVLFIGYLVG